MDTAEQRQHRLAQHYLVRGQDAQRLDATARLSAQTLGFRYGQVNVFDDRSQHTLGRYRLDSMPMVHARQETICAHVVDSGEPVVAEDTRDDPRFAGMPAVRSGEIRSYLGVPVRSRESSTLGTICVLDSRPHRISRAQIEHLTGFARIVEDQLDLIRRTNDRQCRASTANERLARAIAADEIVPWFQPIVDLQTGQTVAWESLARWEHPSGAVESPAHFVPQAEDSDIVLDLDLAIARRALRQARPWLERNPGTYLTVNISTLHLETPGAVEDIHTAARDAGVDPQRVALEITESRALIDETAATSAAADLRSRGFGVVLDDFGSGWSSLDWILQLDVTGLKVDGSVSGALGTPRGDAIAKAMLGFAQDVQLPVVLEGIATQQQAASAALLGYRWSQGFFHSPPVPAAALAAAG